MVRVSVVEAVDAKLEVEEIRSRIKVWSANLLRLSLKNLPNKVVDLNLESLKLELCDSVSNRIDAIKAEIERLEVAMKAKLMLK